MSIKYKAGYKYQIVEPYEMNISITGVVAKTKYVSLYADGRISLRDGYAWDGPSGPAIDTPSFMRGSLIHDALYQLIRLGHPIDRVDADNVLHRMCINDGMNPIRAWWVFQFVRKFGECAASEGAIKPVLTAP